MGDKLIIRVFDTEGLYRTLVCGPTTTSLEIITMFGKKLLWPTPEETAKKFWLYVTLRDGKEKKLAQEESPHPYLAENKTHCESKGLNLSENMLKFVMASSDGAGFRRNTGETKVVQEPPKQEEVAQEEEIAGYLKRRKMANIFASTWVLYRQNATDRSLSLFEDDQATEPYAVVQLANSSCEMKRQEGEDILILTLANSERHVFASDEPGVLQQWYEVLAPAGTATASSAAPASTAASSSGATQRPATTLFPAGYKPPGAKGMGMVPTGADLQVLKKVTVNVTKENIPQQSKALVHWLNWIAEKADIQVSTLENDLKDGLALAILADVLFGKKVKVKPVKTAFDSNENVTTVFDAFTQAGVNIGRATPSDITDVKNVRIVVTLLWNIFNIFLGVEKDALLSWCKNYAESVEGLKVGSFASLNDGLALSAIISEFKPDLLKLEDTLSEQPATRLANVIDIAESQLDIPRLFEPSEASSLDEKVWILYLSFFWLALDDSQHSKWEGVVDRREKASKTSASTSTTFKPPPTTSTGASTTAKPPPQTKQQSQTDLSTTTPTTTARPTSVVGAKPVNENTQQPTRVSVGPIAKQPATNPTPTTPTPTSTSDEQTKPTKPVPTPSPKLAATAKQPSTTQLPVPAQPAQQPVSPRQPTTTEPVAKPVAPPKRVKPEEVVVPAKSPSPPPAAAAAAPPPPPPDNYSAEINITFTTDALPASVSWANEPPTWSIEDNKLIICPEEETDYLQKTKLGTARNNAGFLQTTVNGDFVATTRLELKALSEHDQGGLLVLFDGGQKMVKFFVEHESPMVPSKIGAIVTVEGGYSDWSTSTFEGDVAELKITRTGDEFSLEYFDATTDSWVLTRTCYVFSKSPAQCGLYAASPLNGGCQMEFDFLNIKK